MTKWKNRLVKLFKRNLWFICTLFLVLALIFLIPFFINKLATYKFFKGTSGEFNAWLSFWGSYFGGVISGTITLGGVYLGLKHERNFSLFNRYATQKRKVERFEEWVSYLNQTATYAIKNTNLFDDSVKIIIDESEKNLEDISGVDLELYHLAREIVYEFTWLSYNFEQAHGTDEYNKTYAINKMPNDIERIEEIFEKIMKRNEQIIKVVNRYS